MKFLVYAKRQVGVTERPSYQYQQYQIINVQATYERESLRLNLMATKQEVIEVWFSGWNPSEWELIQDDPYIGTVVCSKDGEIVYRVGVIPLPDFNGGIDPLECLCV